MAEQQESGLGPEELAELGAQLRDREQALRRDIQRELEKSPDTRLAQEGASDLQDWATVDLLTHLNVSEVARDVEEYRAVQLALGRMKSGSYGICQSCGRFIGIERLRAIPETPLCIDCQTRAERNVVETPSL